MFLFVLLIVINSFVLILSFTIYLSYLVKINSIVSVCESWWRGRGPWEIVLLPQLENIPETLHTFNKVRKMHLQKVKRKSVNH